MTADEAMSRLVVAIEAVAAETTGQAPLEIGIGIATIKRELGSGGLAMRSHDLVRRTLGDVGESTVIHLDNYDSWGTGTDSRNCHGRGARGGAGGSCVCLDARLLGWRC